MAVMLAAEVSDESGGTVGAAVGLPLVSVSIDQGVIQLFLMAKLISPIALRRLRSALR